MTPLGLFRILAPGPGSVSHRAVGRFGISPTLNWSGSPSPSGLADFVRRHAPDDYPDLASRLLACRRAAWRCGSYLQLAAQLPPGSVAETAVVWREETDEHEEYGIDLDAAGQPVGVELLHRACTDG